MLNPCLMLSPSQMLSPSLMLSLSLAAGAVWLASPAHLAASARETIKVGSERAMPAPARPIPQTAPLLGTFAEAGPPQASGAMGLHIIEPGDTLFSLARRYGTRVDLLASGNVMSLDGILVPGRVLRVPLSAPTGVTVTSLDAVEAPREHRVAPGETLYGIAGRHGLTVNDLLRWNGLEESQGIQAGATLSLGPSAGGHLGSGSGSDTGTGSGIGTELDGSSGGAALPAQNSSVGLGAPSRAAPDGGSSIFHDVRAGETLGSIAQLYGETSHSLERLNGLDSDLIYVGQRIRVPALGLGPEAAPARGAKRIEVDISEQRMYVWQGETLIWNLVASSGMAGFTTRRGSFAIQSKIPNAWSSPWQLWMPYWMGIYWAGGSENGIHALPINNGQRLWAGYLGSPISYGCIVLSTEDAMKVYNWVEMGTPVIIRD